MPIERGPHSDAGHSSEKNELAETSSLRELSDRLTSVEQKLADLFERRGAILGKKETLLTKGELQELVELDQLIEKAHAQQRRLSEAVMTTLKTLVDE